MTTAQSVMAPAPSSIECELGWALATIMRSYQRIAEEAVADVPGGPRGFLALATVGQGELSTQVALAQHLGVDRTVMTYLLDDLEAAGLVDRRPDPSDRRARRVTLTEDGLSKLCALQRSLHRAEEGLLQSLEGEERTVLRQLLRRLATAIAPATPCQAVQELGARVPAGARPRRRR